MNFYVVTRLYLTSGALKLHVECIQPRLRCLGKSVTLADICRDHDMATHIHHTDLTASEQVSKLTLKVLKETI